MWTRKVRTLTMTTNLIARSFRNTSYAQRRIDRIHLTAAIPLLAINTLLIVFVPPNFLTNSSMDEAWASWFLFLFAAPLRPLSGMFILSLMTGEREGEKVTGWNATWKERKREWLEIRFFFPLSLSSQADRHAVSKRCKVHSTACKTSLIPLARPNFGDHLVNLH